MTSLIRLANPTDGQAIQAIYVPYVRETPITFETQPPSTMEMTERIAAIQKKFPWIVYEADGQVRGYAYAGTHRSRCAYEWSVETSVYVDRNFHREGIGRQLYRCLFELLRDQGVVNVFAGISLPNAVSVGLHESLGFRPVGVFRDIGYKLGKWWDVGWWHLQLHKPIQPAPLKPPISSLRIELASGSSCG